jgi:hypothetical protein
LGKHSVAVIPLLFAGTRMHIYQSLRSLPVPAKLTRAQAYEESENIGRNPTNNATIGDVINIAWQYRCKKGKNFP